MRAKTGIVQCGVLIVAVVIGLIALSHPAEASHFSASSFACAPDAPPGVLQCTLTVGPLTNPLPPGDVITVSLTGGTLVGTPLRAGGACPTGPLTQTGTQTLQLTTAAVCDTGTTIVIAEQIAVAGAAAPCQTIADADVSSTEPATVCSSVVPLPLPPVTVTVVTPPTTVVVGAPQPTSTPLPTPTPSPGAALVVLQPVCSNVVAPTDESVAQLAARVEPRAVLISLWRQIPGTVQFRGAPGTPGVPPEVVDLSAVRALDAVWICVSAPATFRTA